MFRQSYHRILLGASSKPAPSESLAAIPPPAGVQQHVGFHNNRFYSPTAPPHKRVNAFRRFQRIDFLFRKFVSTSYILTMRIRHPAYRQCRLFTDRFRAFRLRLLSADFTELLTKGILRSLLPIGVLVWALWVVLSAFHPSDWPVQKGKTAFLPDLFNQEHVARLSLP